jgi:hypothetical protein
MSNISNFDDENVGPKDIKDLCEILQNMSNSMPCVYSSVHGRRPDILDPRPDVEEYIHQERVIAHMCTMYGMQFIAKASGSILFRTVAAPLHVKMFNACLKHGYAWMALMMFARMTEDECKNIVLMCGTAITAWAAYPERVWVRMNEEAYFATFEAIYACQPVLEKLSYGYTLLYYAIQASALGDFAHKMVRWLVERGIREVMYGKKGKLTKYGPLHHAAYKGDASMVRLLCELGFSVVEHSDKRHKCTLLHLSAQNDNANVDLAQALVEAGANVHALNRHGTNVRKVIQSMTKNSCRGTYLSYIDALLSEKYTKSVS